MSVLPIHSRLVASAAGCAACPHFPKAPFEQRSLCPCDLCSGFLPHGSFDQCYEQIDADEVPAPYDRLLVHETLMVQAFRSYLGRDVTLHVQEAHVDDDCYRRKIWLTPKEEDRTIELGIARVHLRNLPPAAQQQILQRRLPLGAILLGNEVSRRVEPQSFFRLEAAWPGYTAFVAPAAGPAYGRTATIFCDDKPTIEVLEIIPRLSC